MLNLDRRNGLIFLAGWGAFLVGNLAQALAPLIVQAITQHMSMATGKAGYLVSAEFIGIALTAILIGPFINRLPKRKTAIIGCLVAVTMHIISIQFISSYTTLLLMRFFAGLGAGATLAAGGAIIAAAAAPDRMFALVKTFNAMVMAVMIWLAGYAVKGYGVGGGYGVLALIVFCTLPLLYCFPANVVEKQNNAKSRLPHFVLGCLTLFAVLNWVMVVSAPWVYLAIMGERSGLAIEQISGLLGAGFIIGMAGGLLAAWLDLRFGRIIPIIAGILFNGVTWLLICAVPHPVVYTISVLLNNISFFFTLPYLLGTMAALDREGRWASIAATSFLGAIAIAPAVGGLIMDHWNAATLGVFTLTGGLITAVLIVFVVIRLAVHLKLETAVTTG